MVHIKKKEDLVLKEMHINPAICRCGELFKGKHNEKIAGVFDLFQGVKEDITEIVTFQLSFEDWKQTRSRRCELCFQMRVSRAQAPWPQNRQLGRLVWCLWTTNCFKGQIIQCLSALNNKEAFNIKVQVGSPGLIHASFTVARDCSVHLVLSSSTVTFHLVTHMTPLLLLSTVSQKGKERATNLFDQTQSHGHT